MRVLTACAPILLLLAARYAAAANTTDASTWPVIPIPTLCAANCSSLPVTFTVACGACLLGYSGVAPSIPTWSLTSQPYLPRLPLYEKGFTKQPAFTVLYPTNIPWKTANGKVTCAQLANHNEFPLRYPTAVLFDNYQGLPGNVTLCRPSDPTNCTTLPLGNEYQSAPNALGVLQKAGLGACCACKPSVTDFEYVSMLAYSCVKSVGLLSGAVGAVQPFAKCGTPTRGQGGTAAAPYVPEATSFNTPEHLAMAYTTNPASGGKYAAFGRQAKAEAVQYYTNADRAADSLWEVMHLAFSANLHLRKPAVSEEARLKVQFGTSWKPLCALLTEGKLYEMDLATWQADFSFNLDPTTPGRHANQAGWNVGAHMLFERINKGKAGMMMRVVAVRLSGLYHSHEAAVFTQAKSPTAFILAMACARASYWAMVIFLGHLYSQHTIQGAASYALYNSIQPGVAAGAATHPMRLVLDIYMNPYYLSGFAGGLWGGLASPPPTPATPPQLTQLFEIYSVQGPLGMSDNTLWSLLPANQLKRGHLHQAEFTSPGGKPWDLYPLASFQVELLGICASFATKILAQYYPTDASVAADTGIQALASGLVAPLGANLRQFNAKNSLKSRADLADFVGFLIYTSIAHGTSHLQDYTMRTFSVAHLPPRTELLSMPSPTKTYTMQELISAAPSVGTYNGQFIFMSAFAGAQPITQIVGEDASGSIDWTAGLPFPNSTLPGQAANAATVAFRKALSIMLDRPHDKYVKVTNTNFGPSILRVPPIVDI